MNRRERLAALAAEHDAWIQRNLETADENFDASGRREGSDYNQHHVDIDANGTAQDDFSQRAARIFGMDWA